MRGCTHPTFMHCEIVNVYAGAGAMMCVKGASLLRMREMGKRGQWKHGTGACGESERSEGVAS
jgi:hypothetical protein